MKKKNLNRLPLFNVPFQYWKFYYQIETEKFEWEKIETKQCQVEKYAMNMMNPGKEPKNIFF